ncbi:MAG: iron-only hydrogenase system regulator [Bacteroidales bacterium]|nr:iron-only hydrogenase system regulator [Bacteroidales bacterium]
MEKRLGSVIILLENTTVTSRINAIISEYAHLVLGRQGIPLHDRGISIISLVLEGNTDEIGALTGKLGRIAGVKVKSVLTG